MRPHGMLAVVAGMALAAACSTEPTTPTKPTTPPAGKSLASAPREKIALPYPGFQGVQTALATGEAPLMMAPRPRRPPPTVVYNTIPDPYPHAFASIGFEATSTVEFGDRIMLAGTGRKVNTVVVSMDDWACQNDFSGGPGTWERSRTDEQDCVTKPGSFFTHPLTLNIYAVDHTLPDPAVGAKLATQTITANIPFRQSHSRQCPNGANDVPFGGTWFDPQLRKCVHGYAFNVTFDLAKLNVTLPNEVIVSVAYNTADYGTPEIGLAGPYNSLNLSVDPAAPTVGTNVDGDEVFFNSSWGGAYCDGGASGTGTFRRDFGTSGNCVPPRNWGGDTPVITINVKK